MLPAASGVDTFAEAETLVVAAVASAPTVADEADFGLRSSAVAAAGVAALSLPSRLPMPLLVAESCYADETESRPGEACSFFNSCARRSARCRVNSSCVVGDSGLVTRAAENRVPLLR